MLNNQQQTDRLYSSNKVIPATPASGFEDIIDSKSQASKILAKDPTNISALQVLAACHMQLNEFESAKTAYEKLIELQPQNPEGYFNLSIACKKMHKYQAALGALQKAIGLDDQYVSAHNSLGLIFRKLGRYDQAIASFRQAIKIDRSNAKAFNNLGLAISEAKKLNNNVEIQDAFIALNEAITLEPENAKPRNDLGAIYLQHHNFKQGFDLFEWRWRANNWKRFESDKPIWEGQPNKKVLVWREQGVGDEIMFSSILSDLCAVSESVHLIADNRLLKLFSRSLLPNVKVLSQDASLEGIVYDCHIPIGSLPRFFRKQAQDFKSASAGFLNADKGRSRLLRNSLCQNSKQKLIGLSWHTVSTLPESQQRNIDLLTLSMSLISIDAVFVSLQYNDHHQLAENAQHIAGIPIKQAAQLDKFNDLDGLAALISACDEVITIDNSTAHFAGALGVSTRLLLPINCDWRWGRCETRSYWYESVQIYRQAKDGVWDHPLQQITNSL